MQGNDAPALRTNILYIAPGRAPNFRRELEFLDLLSRPFAYVNHFQIFANDQDLFMAVIGPGNSVLSWVVHSNFQPVHSSVHVPQMDVVELRRRVENIRRDEQLLILVHVGQNIPDMQEHVAMDWATKILTIYKHGHLGQQMNLNPNLPPPGQQISINNAVLRHQLEQIFGPFYNHSIDFLRNALHPVTLTARQDGSLEINSPTMNEARNFDHNSFAHHGNPLEQEVNITYRLQSLRCLADYGARIMQPYTILMLTPPFALVVDHAFVFPNEPAFTTDQIIP
ncbi:hypothetical protein SLEP1_g2433 [Rubroshorea leprosula]|uniref:Uncharacterized protein n=1 Tax=Rubroshorea leprosula TaxID=152421 RepID=A0AAV5HH59_9ROSI|nr:hypothetical protein SLEP1_g2433 [Rubroshorea leprosula]